MSKLFNNILSLLILFAILNSILCETIFWDIKVTKELINLGQKGECFLTIYLKDVPKQKIDFDNTVIIGIDLENPDSTFIVQLKTKKSI